LNVLFERDGFLLLRSFRFLDEKVLSILVILLVLRLGLELEVILGHVLEVNWSLSDFSFQGKSSSYGS
jgi:hypothetical protein